MSIKIFIGSEIRRLNISDIKDYADLHKRLSTFAKNETSIYKYQDVDGDWVTFNSQEEWQEAIKNHHKDGFKLKVVSENDKCGRFRQDGEERKCGRFQQGEERKGGCPRFQHGHHGHHHGPKHGFQGFPFFQQPQRGQCGSNGFSSQLESIVKDLFGGLQGVSSGNLNELFKSPNTEKDGKAIHNHVVCDGCEVTPIVGNRYRCNELKDFDLCQPCYDKKSYPKEHTFTLVAKPIGTAGFWQDFVNDIYKEAEKYTKEEKKEEVKPEEVKKEEIIVLEEDKNDILDQVLYENLAPVVEEKPQVVEQAPEVPQYVEQQDLLKSMGFFNTDANLVFLKKHGGNIQRVVGELLNQ